MSVADDRQERLPFVKGRHRARALASCTGAHEGGPSPEGNGELRRRGEGGGRGRCEDVRGLR